MKYVYFNSFKPSTRLWLMSLALKYRFIKLLKMVIDSPCTNALPSQKTLINKRDWDLLIIIDACRYDIFSQEVYKYLDGELSIAVSPASITINWLKEIWASDKWRDVVYVSATPFVNKRGLLKDFDAGKFFLDVIEVWDWGWNSKSSTIPPENVNAGVRIAITKMKLRKLSFPKDYKIVAHYIQPHSPYLTLQNAMSKISKIPELQEQMVNIAFRKYRRIIGRFGMEETLLGLFKEVLKNHNDIVKVLEQLYRDNLRRVLKAIASLLNNIDGHTIITSDHGELLGEYGLFFHPDIPLPHLRIVPWFKVK